MSLKNKLKNKTKLNVFKSKKGDLFPVQDIYITIIIIFIMLIFFSGFFLAGYIFKQKLQGAEDAPKEAKLGFSSASQDLRIYLNTKMSYNLNKILPVSYDSLTTEQKNKFDKNNLFDNDKTFIEFVEEDFDKECIDFLESKGDENSVMTVYSDEKTTPENLDDYFKIFDLKGKTVNNDCKQFLLRTVLLMRTICYNDFFEIKIHSSEEIVIGMDKKPDLGNKYWLLTPQIKARINDQVSHSEILLPFKDTSKIELNCYYPKDYDKLLIR